MKVTIHTPRVLVEEWDIPDLPAGAADAAILAIVRGHGPQGWQARRLAAADTDVASAFVYARGQDDIEAAARRLAEVRAASEQAMEAARLAAQRAFDNGASERKVSDVLGVDRNTVRAWRGKPRTA